MGPVAERALGEADAFPLLLGRSLGRMWVLLPDHEHCLVSWLLLMSAAGFELKMLCLLPESTESLGYLGALKKTQLISGRA